jgi:hypothetical protein
MIDQEWLGNLNFIGTHGLHIEGLAGLGSEKVVFKATAPDGKELVIQTYRHHLGYHIREIPLLLSDKPLYDVRRLNRKLAQIVGDNSLDEMSADYDRLFSSVIRILFEGCTKGEQSRVDVPGVLAALSMFVTPASPEALPFLLGTPMMARRLQELATLSPDPANPISFWVRVNGPNFPIEAHADQIKGWATDILAYCRSANDRAPFEPESLSRNPMFVWGAAVTDEFFVDDELPAAVMFIEEEFGRLPSHPNVVQLLEQISAIASLMACVLKESKVDRLVKLCGMLGLMFDVHDREGKIVASSVPRRLDR